MLPPTSTETPIGTPAGNQSTNEQTPQSVASDANGDYVIVWTSTSRAGVYAKFYQATWTGEPTSRQASYSTGDADPGPARQCRGARSPRHATVACDATGDFVVTWDEQDSQIPPRAGDWNVWAQRFDKMGTP